MSESISNNNELENEMTLDMSYFWYSDAVLHGLVTDCNTPQWSFEYHWHSVLG